MTVIDTSSTITQQHHQMISFSFMLSNTEQLHVNWQNSFLYFQEMKSCGMSQELLTNQPSD